MKNCRYVFLIDPFGYSTDYNLPLINSLNRGLDSKKYIYFTSRINNNYFSKYQIIYFFKFTKNLIDNFPKIKKLLKLFGVFEYCICYIKLIFIARKRKAAIHVIWIKTPFIDSFLLILMRLLNIHVFYTMHNAFPHDKNSFLTKYSYLFFYKIPNKIIVLSLSEKDKVTYYNDDLKSKIFCIPHGLMLEEIPSISQIQARRELGIEYGGQIILFFGLIRPYKGIFTLLDSCNLLKSKHVDFRLIIAGKNNLDSELNKNLETYINDNKAILYFEGYHSKTRMRDFICASDLVVLPYNSGTQSGISYAALRYLKPILPTRVGNLLETVPDKFRYLSPPPESPELLAESIDKVLKLAEMNEYVVDLEKIKCGSSWKSIASRHINEIYI